MANIRGITLEIGGDTTQLTKALSDVDKSIKTTQGDLRDVNKLLKLDPTNTELLRQKQQLLSTAIAETKNRLQTLKDAQAQMDASGVDKTSSEYQNLQREIIATEQKLGGLETQLKEFGSVGAQQVAAVGEKFKDIGGKISDAGQKMTTAVTLPVVGAFTLAAKSASDFEENLNKVDVAFGENAEEVKAWAETATQEFGLSKNAALEATSLFGDMGTAMGLSTSDAAEMSTALAGLAGDLSSFKNVDIQQAMNALKGVFTGETESLKGLGIIMNQTNLKAFAEDLGLVYDDMSQAELVTLRYQYVLENTKNAQGDYARTADGTANSIRTFQATLSNLSAEIGTVLLPIITPIIQKITEWVQKLGEADETTKQIIVVIGLIAAAIGPVLVILGTVISSVGTIMTTLAPLIGFVTSTVIPAIAAIASPVLVVVAVIGGLIAILVELYRNNEEFRDKVNAVWEQIKTFISNAVNAVKTAISNALTAISTTWNNNWTAVQTFATTVFTNIQNTIATIISAVQNVISNALNFISNAWTSGWNLVKSVAETVWNLISTAVNTYINAIKTVITAAMQLISGDWQGAWNTIKNFVTETFGNIVSTVTEKVGNIKETITTNVGAAVDFLKELPARALQWGKDLIENFVDGLKSKWESLKNTVSDFAGGIADFIGFSEPEKGALKDFHTFAPDMMKLYAQGIKDNSYLVTDQIQNLANAMAGGMAGGMAQVNVTSNTYLDGRLIASTINNELGAML